MEGTLPPTQQGLTVLSTPFGNDAYVQQRLELKREEHDRLLQRILVSKTDLQAALPRPIPTVTQPTGLSCVDTLRVSRGRDPSVAERLQAALRDDRAARLPSLLASHCWLQTQAAAYLTTQGYAVPSWDEPADFPRANVTMNAWLPQASYPCGN